MEIDLILEHRIKNSVVQYKVLLRNSKFESNEAWLLKDALEEYEDLVYYYESLQNPPENIDGEMMLFFIKDLVTHKPYDTLTLIKLCSLIFGCDETILWSLNLSLSDLKKKVIGILDIPLYKLNRRKKELLALMKFSEERKLSLIFLKQWEKEINTISSSPIYVENNVDADGPPKPFKYVNDYVSFSCTIPYDPVVFCSCENCVKSNKCCPHNYEVGFPYDKNGRLQLLPGYPIYECNKKCSCGDSCLNRVVQQGSKVNLAIFKTSDDRGWGLKSLQNIETGIFIIEYLGEIITSDQAEDRGSFYDCYGSTYLFDLDMNQEESAYTVDGFFYGNAARFINHSCDPNMYVFSVSINESDPRLPRLAFFTKRRISCGEELTFDYKMIDKSKNASQNGNMNVLCKCNSKNCRKYLC